MVAGPDLPSSSTTSTRLNIALLGAPRLARGGQRPLRLPRRQPLALLARLALAGGPVPRDHLAFLFWADAPQALARRRLRRTLGQLRQSLASEGFDALIAAEGETVDLDLAACTVDVVEFRRLARPALAAVGPTVIDVGERALALYTGPLLAGLVVDEAPELEHWLTAERERLAHEHLQLLAAVAAAHEAAGSLPRALALAEALVQADPLREDAQRLLMRLYAALGQRTRALQQYERCVISLEQELGVLPLPETRALYRALLNDATAPAHPPVPVSAPPAAWNARPAQAAPCLGRASELAAVRALLERGLAGQPAVVCLSGPAGIGKTRLLNAAVEGQQRPVWLGGGQPGGQVIPYAAVLPALRQAISAHLAQAQLPDLWLAEASRVLPELRLLRPGLTRPAELPHEQAQARLFEALTRLVVDLACASGGAILALDNLEETDAPTLAWVAGLAGRLPGVPLAVIVAQRTDEPQPHLDAWHAGLARRGLRHAFELGPLPVDTILGLLASLALSSGAAERLAARLHAETGGVPLFLLETIRMLASDPAGLAEAATADWPLPASIREVLTARLRHLTPIERQVAEVCAVLGEAPSEASVRAVAGRDDFETAAALDQLARRQWLVDTDLGYRFAHAQVAEAVYQHIGGARRRLLHRRAAETLRAWPATPAAVLARHYEHAGDQDQAATFWLAAAQQSWDRFAAEPALRAAANALQLARQPAERLACLALTDEILHQLGRRDAQAEVVQHMTGLLDQLAAGEAALVRQREGRLHLALSRWSAAESALRAALQLQPASDLAQRLLAVALAEQQRWPEAIAAAEQALSWAAERHQPAAQGEALRTLAQLTRRREDWSASEAYARRGLALPGLHAALCAGLTSDLAEAQFWRGHYAAALAQAGAALALARAQADRHGEAVAHNLAGRCFTRLNRNAEALAAYRQARDLFEQIGHISGQASATGNMGALAMRLADLEQAQLLHTAAFQLFESIGEARGQCIASNNLGTVLSWLGRGGEAEPLLRASLARARAAGLRVQEAVNLGCLGASLVALGRIAEGVDCMERGLAQRRALNHLDTCIDAACLAVAYLRLGRLVDAAELSRQAVRELETAPGGVAHPQRVHFGLAQVMRVLGRPSEAAAALAEAQSRLAHAAAALAEGAERERYLHNYVFNRDLTAALAGHWPEPPRLS